MTEIKNLVLFPFSVKDVKRLEAARLGTRTNAATPFGVLPALKCSLEVYETAFQYRETELKSFWTGSGQLTDYLLRRFRLRVVR